ncbi:MAG: restriction endonuclease, partial [Lentisphaeria bacterium]|nr:restriction endonuclease [Lentisphaeria bacterium]
RMRSAIVNVCSELVAKYPRFVMRITGDNDEGKRELDNFIDPESITPVVATTSKLLTTGVDTKTCKLIVLDQRIQSMSEFKQIIGRGTRIDEDYGKMSFAIMDFRRATELFADPDFDGEPVHIYEPPPNAPVVPPDDPGPDDGGNGEEGEEGGEGRTKYYVDDVDVEVMAIREQYMDPKSGKLITESFKLYTRRRIRAEFDSLDDFLQRWNQTERKTAVLAELEEQGVLFDELRQAVGSDYDAFDLVCHVAFDRPPLTRKERADSVRKRDCFAKYGDQARDVLEALLEKYADHGIADLESMDVLRVAPVSQLGTPIELVRAFGGKKGFQKAVAELEQALYATG